MKKIGILIFCLSSLQIFAQTDTFESMQISSPLYSVKTTIGAYGNIFYQRNANKKDANLNIERCMLILQHQFNQKISLFSELGVEDLSSTKINGNEMIIQQAYLKFQFHAKCNLVAGLFLPRIGLLNERRFPNQYFGNERNYVETFIIPATWRHLGLAVNGTITKLPLSYQVAIVNGLNSANFEHGSVIREGRIQGRNVSANNMAVIASLQYKKNKIKAQVSTYYGGSVSLTPNQADSLQLSSGFFGTPVMLGDVSIVYASNRLSMTLLASGVSIQDAASLNRAYANNTPELAYGAYAELAYCILQKIPYQNTKSHELTIFARYETLDMNGAIPANGQLDETLQQQFLITGFQYSPLKNVFIKTDIRFSKTGKQNLPNPNPNAPKYNRQNSLLHIGLGFSL